MPKIVDATTDWLRFRHAPKLSIGTLYKLLERFGSTRRILQASAGTLADAGLSRETIAYLLQPDLPAAIELSLEWADQQGNTIVSFDHPAYPPLLKTIHNPPLLLYVRGNVNLLADPQLAIIGSRNPTTGGYENAKSFAEHFSRSGLVITSGLALGIDSAAHQGALAQSAPTIAVMATGADQIYPARHKKLAAAILEQGALVSEMPLNTKPLPELFPQRNRIISGMSLGVLVVEAAQRSGSLITARLAMEQSREVFALPGSIHNPLARGCHHLIRQGAKLVESAQDVLEELAPQIKSILKQDSALTFAHAPESEPLDAEYDRLLKALGFDAISIDQIAQRSGLAPKEVASMLLILELQGLVCAEPSGLYSRVQGN